MINAVRGLSGFCLTHVNPETREPLSFQDPERTRRLLELPTEGLHDFLIHQQNEYPSFDYLQPIVKAELERRRDQRDSETHELTRKTHQTGEKVRRLTVWILWLTALGIAATIVFALLHN